MFYCHRLITSSLLALIPMVGIGIPEAQAATSPGTGSEEMTGSVARTTPHLHYSAIAGLPQPASSSSKAAQRVKVFFPKNPAQQNNFAYVEPVWRQSHDSGLAQFAVQQLIAGPTSQEKQRGFLPAVRLQGASNCGKDFTLAIASGVAKLRFCKQVPSAGIGDDARITSAITATLKQFPTIRSVVMLNRDGGCLIDPSGDNRCWQGR